MKLAAIALLSAYPLVCAFGADFIISYRGAAKNYVMVSEKLLIARAMTPFENRAVKREFEFEIGAAGDGESESESVEKLLKTHQESLLEGLLKVGAELNGAAENTAVGASEKSVLTLRAVKIGAVIKEDIVKISVFED